MKKMRKAIGIIGPILAICMFVSQLVFTIYFLISGINKCLAGGQCFLADGALFTNNQYYGLAWYISVAMLLSYIAFLISIVVFFAIRRLISKLAKSFFNVELFANDNFDVKDYRKVVKEESKDSLLAMFFLIVMYPVFIFAYSLAALIWGVSHVIERMTFSEIKQELSVCTCDKNEKCADCRCRQAYLDAGKYV